jgi:hypothetical protein
VVCGALAFRHADKAARRLCPTLLLHYIGSTYLKKPGRDVTGSVYGRRMYEVMRIWDEDLPEWSTEQTDFAAAWRNQPKWVKLVGEIAVSGPDLAQSLTALGLVDEYQL